MRLRWRYLVLVLLVGYLLTGLAPVRPEERAVVRRFGQVVARPGPGLWIGLPWGLDRLDRVAVRTARQLAMGYVPEADSTLGQFLTGDQNLVNVRLIVEYAVDETDAGLDAYIINRDQVEPILTREIETLTAEWLGGQTVDAALLTGRAELPRWVGDRLDSRLQPHQLGVVVSRVSVDILTAPPDVREAFEQVNQAQTGIRTKENQARQDAAQRLREAEALQFRLTQQAEAYRQEKVSLATAEATAFRQRLEQYRVLAATNPAIRESIWWDEMSRVFAGLKSRGRIELLDQHIGPNGLDITQFVPPRRK
jgi:membrane protease subunit HflK